MDKQTRHTPAPWEAHGTLIYWNGPEGGTICAMSSLRASSFVQYEPIKLDDPDWAEQMANRDLIARAPDLFAALRRLREVVGEHRDLHPEEAEVLNQVDKALEGIE